MRVNEYEESHGGTQPWMPSLFEWRQVEPCTNLPAWGSIWMGFMVYVPVVLGEAESSHPSFTGLLPCRGKQ
jgi:hypothetical protein